MSGKEQAINLLKNPAVGNGTSGVLLALIVLIGLNPDLLPYAVADHKHDIEAVQKVVVSTVTDALRLATLASDIKQEAAQISRLDAQILAGLCIRAQTENSSAPAVTCPLERQFKSQAQSRKRGYEAELNVLRASHNP